MIILQIILTAIFVHSKNAKTFHSEFELFKQTIFTLKNVDVSKVIRDIVFSDWTENHHCAKELHAIKRARKHNEEWALKSKLELINRLTH